MSYTGYNVNTCSKIKSEALIRYNGRVPFDNNNSKKQSCKTDSVLKVLGTTRRKELETLKGD